MEIKDFVFPVKKSTAYFVNAKGNMVIAPKQQSIIRADTDQFISFQNSTYKIIPNEEIISSAIIGLDKVGFKSEILPKQSYLANEKMDLCLKLPEIKYLEGTKDEGNLVVYLKNSYDGSGSVSFQFGTFRLICSNGAYVVKLLNKYYKKHTKGFDIDAFAFALENAYNTIPQIAERYNILRNMEISEETLESVNNISKKVEKVVKENIDNPTEMTQYEQVNNMLTLYNLLTYFVSHNIKIKNQGIYQQKISNIFGV